MELPVEQILCAEPRGILSLAGGGGKTSLMFHLARQLSRAGKRVLTTTTTKIHLPTSDQSETLIIAHDQEEILKKAASCRTSTNHITAVAAQMNDKGKLQGFSPEAIRAFYESGLFDWIIIEADGARMRPLKAPAVHEPVVPLETTVMVAVAGLEVIGAPFTDELVFRTDVAGPIMGLADGEIITEAALARLFAHPSGSFKGAPPAARRFIFLNKADSQARRDAGARVAEELRQLENPAVEALIVAQARPVFTVHAVHSLQVQR